MKVPARLHASTGKAAPCLRAGVTIAAHLRMQSLDLSS